MNRFFLRHMFLSATSQKKSGVVFASPEPGRGWSTIGKCNCETKCNSIVLITATNYVFYCMNYVVPDVSNVCASCNDYSLFEWAIQFYWVLEADLTYSSILSQTWFAVKYLFSTNYEYMCTILVFLVQLTWAFESPISQHKHSLSPNERHKR